MARRFAALVVALAATTAILAQVRAQVRAQEGAPESAALPIYAIQGRSAVSPMLDERVAAYGLVTAVAADGFFLQDPTGDGDPATSDGIFVYTRSAPTVRPGECVLVRAGYVDEFYAKTEIARAESVAPSALCGAAAVEPVPLPMPRLGGDPALLYEPLEGMLVRVEEFRAVVYGPTKHFEGGDVEIAVVPAALHPYLDGGRIFYDEKDETAALLFLTNGLGATLPAANQGDTLALPAQATALTGVLDYNFGKYQLALLPATMLEVQPGDTRLPAATGPAGADDFTLCSFNLLGLGRGSSQYPDADEHARQVRRRGQTIADALHGCTILALQETGTPADAAALAETLERDFGLDYAAVALEGPGSHSAEFPLTNSLLARRDRVRILDATLHQACVERSFDVPKTPGDCPAGQYALFERPPLVVTLRVEDAWGEALTLTVVNNHWKSLSGDAQENALRRRFEVQAVAALVQGLLDADPTAHIAVIGDLNDFYGGEPIQTLRTSVQPPLVHTFDYATALDRYTYIYDGVSDVIDQALVTPGLARMVAGVAAVHVNADYAEAADHSGEHYTSDHDPVWLRFRPAGAAALGGSLAFPGVGVTLLDAEHREAGRTVTDAQGEFRLLGLEPGAYTLRLEMPPGVEPLDEEPPLLELQAGYQELTTVRLRHRATAAGASAIRSLLP